MQSGSLFVEQISDPEDPLPLLDLYRVQAKARTPFMEPYAVCETDGRRYKEKRRLRVWSPQQEQSLTSSNQ